MKLKHKIMIIILLCILCLCACEPKEEYKETFAYQDITHIQQSYKTTSEGLIITFLAHDPDKKVEIEITLYDGKNQKIAVVKKGYNDIIFNNYDLNYKILISNAEYPTAKSAKITEYKYTVYEKI